MRYDYGNQHFVNPYQFVSLEASCKRGYNYRNEKKRDGLRSGWLECKLDTLTPIFIPNTTNNDTFRRRAKEDQINSYDFYSYDDLEGVSNPPPAEPVIPGSELRGMIRSAFETVTASCMSAVDEKNKLYKRTTVPAPRCGRLRKQNSAWFIQPGTKYMIKATACDKDPNFISLIEISDHLLDILLDLTYQSHGQIRRYLRTRVDRRGQNEYSFDTEMKKFSQKISITPDGWELHYHTRMTNDEKTRLLSLSGDQEFQQAINTLFRDSQPYHDISQFTEGTPIWFRAGDHYDNRQFMPKIVSEISLTQQKGFIKGYFHKGESIARKHHETIIVTGDQQIPLAATDNETQLILENLKRNLELYKSDEINIHKRSGEHTGYSLLSSGKLDDLDGMLIYYAHRNGKYYLSPAAIGREVFHKMLPDLLGEFAPCTDIDNLCAACSMFGMVTEKKEVDKDVAVSSRVRFTDATVQTPRPNKQDYYDPIVTLPELASPKLSCTEFYLKKPQRGAIWNYDYAITWNNRQPQDVANYQPRIRGRKYYWHQHIRQAPAIQKPSKRNVAIRPLKKENTFTFKVFFNDLTDTEIQKLIWVLEIGGSRDHAHKLGMGKPVGLGSVQVKVENVCIREIRSSDTTIDYAITTDNRSRDAARKNDFVKDIGISENIVDQFKKMTDFAHAPENISYPVNENSTAIYEWFGANKTIPPGTGTAPVIAQELPDIGKPDQRLKKYRRTH